MIVSTDDEEIRRGREYGAEAPFLRPAALAQDDTPDLPVFQHALRWLERGAGRRPEIVVQLRSDLAAPAPGLVDEAIDLLASCPDADSLRSVTPPYQNPYKMWTHQERWLRPVLGRFSQELFNRPRQTLPVVWWQTGHLDVVRRTTLLAQGSMTGRKILPFAVDPRHAIDIDTPDQWAFAEWLIASADLDLVRPIPVEESA